MPLFWPLAAAATLGNRVFAAMQRNIDYAVAVGRIDYPAPPEWASPKRIRLDLKAMRVREFSEGSSGITPVLIDAPFAGHSATIADFDKGQRLVETMLTDGAHHVLVTDWKTATAQMRYTSSVRPSGLLADLTF